MTRTTRLRICMTPRPALVSRKRSCWRVTDHHLICQVTFDGTWVTIDRSNAAAPADDPTEQLKKLADLYQSGLLTDEEFATKRAAIIERL
jgi:Short C-terminal domain